MLSLLRAALAATAALTLLTGIAYPLALTGIGAALWPERAAGSLIARNDVTIGSALIAQAFDRPAYLQPRPSASGFSATPSGASNLGPTSRALREAVAARRAAYEAANGTPAPIDAVTASASGLDPDISPGNARAQAARIAAARGVAPAQVRALIDRAVTPPLWSLYGLPRVNVLKVNLALDAAFGTAPSDTQ